MIADATAKQCVHTEVDVHRDCIQHSTHKQIHVFGAAAMQTVAKGLNFYMTSSQFKKVEACQGRAVRAVVSRRLDPSTL